MTTARRPKARAANGLGTVYRRASDGFWVCAVTVRGERVVKAAKTRAEAEVKRLELIGRRDAGMLIPGRTPTVGQWLESWLESVVRPNRAAWTARGYEVLVRKHIAPVLGGIKLDRLEPARVRLWQAEMGRKINPRTGHPYSGKTVAYARQVLHTALAQAVKDGVLARNPVDLVDGPRVERKEIPVLLPEEVGPFRRVAQNDRLAALWLTAMLGLRQGELLGLRWADVDAARCELRVRQQLQRVGGRLQLVPLKTKKSRRTLPLPGFISSALVEHRGRQASEDVVNVMGLVFTNEVGLPIDARYLQKRFKRLLRQAGVPDRPFHSLRHSAATFLLLQGVELKTVQEILGHASLQTTSDIYAHVLDRMKRDAAARLDALWGELG